MTNIRTVAKIAGVSVATVSRALSTPDVVSDKTRDKVQVAIKEAGYKPNMMARNFRAKKSYALLVLVPDIANPFFSRVISGIEEAAQKRGYSVLLGNTRGCLDREREYTKMVDSLQADGIIQLSARYPLDKVVPVQELPIVNICECFNLPQIPQIELDNHGAAKALVKHLIELGHQRISVIKGPDDSPLTASRLSGYCAALEEANIGFDEKLVVDGDFTMASGHSAVEKLLARRERPTALFCFNDEMAIGAIKSIKSLGFNVPEDISVAGFDDIAYANYCDPPLTTIEQPAELFGKQAVETLCDIINGKAFSTEKSTLSFELIVRQSTSKITI
ncbi:LacI family transcriptional regulator [Alteromonadaceae bacterium M269]|nr:LacI family transcriptional regulator [Alteromonadaceae bacterium M269]